MSTRDHVHKSSKQQPSNVPNFRHGCSSMITMSQRARQILHANTQRLVTLSNPSRLDRARELCENLSKFQTTKCLIAITIARPLCVCPEHPNPRAHPQHQHSRKSVIGRYALTVKQLAQIFAHTELFLRQGRSHCSAQSTNSQCSYCITNAISHYLLKLKGNLEPKHWGMVINLLVYDTSRV